MLAIQDVGMVSESFFVMFREDVSLTLLRFRFRALLAAFVVTKGACLSDLEGESGVSGVSCHTSWN